MEKGDRHFLYFENISTYKGKVGGGLQSVIKQFERMLEDV